MIIAVLISIVIGGCVNTSPSSQEQQSQVSGAIDLIDITDNLQQYDGKQVQLKAYAKKTMVESGGSGTQTFYYAIQLYPSQEEKVNIIDALNPDGTYFSTCKDSCGLLKDGEKYLLKGTIKKISKGEAQVRWPRDYALFVESFEEI